MSKILIAITDDTYVRNYLRSTALSALRESHDLRVIAHRGLALAEEVSRDPGFLGFYDLDPVMERRHHLLFNLMMWRYRRKSRTFFYRWLRNSNWHLVKRNGAVLARIASYIHWFAAALINPRGIRIPVLANRLIFPIMGSMVKKSITPNPTILRLIEDEGFDLIMYPSAAFDSVSVDLVSLGQRFNIPTLCLIDNWDNLSSKTVFWKKPDHLGVWGPQAHSQAWGIHGFSPDRVHLIGTPRFDSYFEARRNSGAHSPHDFPYALFVGSAMPFDEIGTLKVLEKILIDSDNLPDDFRLIYRPHPWQHKRNVESRFYADDFTHVILDPQIDEAQKAGRVRGTNDPSFQPDLGYYPGLLLSSQFVVGPLTTMLLEASLCLRPVVALSYFDGFHANTSQRYFSHFDGMENVPGFFFCNDKASLSSLISGALQTDTISAHSSDDQTSHFLYRDDRSYPQRLEELARDIIGGDPVVASSSL
jgi:hypothetical protein